MDLTKNEIIEKMRNEMPYWLKPKLEPYIKEAMQLYADQEAKAYASWLSNQVIAGRTATKLFNDYKRQFELSAKRLRLGEVAEYVKINNQFLNKILCETKK